MMDPKLILDFYKLPEFQKLNAYYMQSTVFSVLGVQRSENRHSAFLAWLLNPDAPHSLKEMPLRNFLALIAAKADDQDKCYFYQVRQHLLSGDYQLKVDCVKTEQSIVGLANEKLSDLDGIVEKTDNGQFKKDSQNRFDIWMLVHITFTDEQDCEQNWTVPVIVENKIYSPEGYAGNEEKAQTIRYHRAMGVLQNVVCDDNYCQPLQVYLTPSDTKKGPTAPSFIHLTYQDMLDYVIQPCASAEKSDVEVGVLINGYIRNLSYPSNHDGENVRDYSILAIAEPESQDLDVLFKSEGFEAALCAVFPEEAQALLGLTTTEMPDDTPRLEQFWNANENLFKIVLYNHFKNDIDKLAVVQRIVKVNNRDNTRYFVAVKQGEPWLNKKAASKSEASFLIFKAYCLSRHEMNPSAELSVDDLRSEFDSSLNSYYHNRFLKYLFYDFDQDVTVDVEGNKHFGNALCPESDDWDFYWDNDHILPNVKGQVRSVKMWRKDNFDRLVEIAVKLGIVVEAKE